MAKSMKMLRGMPDCFHTKMRSVALFFACFGLTFGRYLYWGWQYYPQLDDVVQYGLRETLPMSRWQFILDYGLLKTRPMAGIGDVFVWSKMYGDLVIALFLLTLLFVLSAFLFAKLFSRHFGTSVVFAVIYLLIPINMEGAWWISASSRIVPGLFFTALSACLLQEYIDGGKKRYLWCYFPAALLSMMFYEQCLVLSVAVSFLVLLLNFRYQRRAFWGVGILLCAMIYFVFTEMQPDSVTYSGRMELIWPWSPHYFDVFFPDIRSQIQNVLVNGTVLTYAKGFWRGIQMIIGSPNFLWLFLIALLSAVLAWFFYLPKKKKEEPFTVFSLAFCWPLPRFPSFLSSAAHRGFPAVVSYRPYPVLP